MSKKIKFNIQEYAYIRAEIIQRISIIHSQTYTAIVTIITTFGAGLSLNYTADNVVDNNSFNNEIILLTLIRSFIFLIPILYLFPLAVKSGENLIQIASLSAYIRVFYDYISERKNKMNWEISNNILSNGNIDRGAKNFLAKFFNGEYTILAIISLILFIIFSVNSIITLESAVERKYLIMIVVLYCIITIILLCVIILIHKSSSMKCTIMRYTPIYIEVYIKRAVQLGIIEESNIEKAKKELNPFNEIEIKNGFWSRL